MGYLVALAAMREGKNVTYLPAYGAEMRGGTANCTVAVSDREIASPVASAPNYAVIMNNPSLLKFANLVQEGGSILLNQSLVHAKAQRDDLKVISLSVTELAAELGDVRSANVVMVGALAQATGIVGLDALKEALAETGLGKKANVLKLNQRALELGAQKVRELLKKERSA
jgi:2-oxoglutarate ferredoxin oxidoreductase subunit gamma